MRRLGGVAVIPICLRLHGLAQMTGKEAHDYVVRLPRLGQIGVHEECVPHSVPDVQLCVDPHCGKRLLSVKQRAHRKIPRPADEKSWRESRENAPRLRREDQRIAQRYVAEIRREAQAARLRARQRRLARERKGDIRGISPEWARRRKMSLSPLALAAAPSRTRPRTARSASHQRSTRIY